MRAAAAEFAKPLDQGLDFARESRSDFTRADRAAAAAAEAGERLEALKERFPEQVHELAAGSHRALQAAIEIWQRALHGGGEEDWAQLMSRRVEEAEQERLRFRKAVTAELESSAGAGRAPVDHPATTEEKLDALLARLSGA
jgi:hypothetical protein